MLYILLLSRSVHKHEPIVFPHEMCPGGSNEDSLYILREELPSIESLEAQLKACLCRLVFSKAKVRIALRRQFPDIAVFMLKSATVLTCCCPLPQPSVLALSLFAQEFDTHQSSKLLRILHALQGYLKVIKGVQEQVVVICNPNFYCIHINCSYYVIFHAKNLIVAHIWV